jgi:formylmethanofuran dehydrogenase subunit C
MSAGYILSLRARPPHRVDLGGLTPSALTGLSRAEVEKTPVRLGNRAVALAELFKVSGTSGDRLAIRNGCDRLDGIGRGLDGGEIVVEGDCGAYLGEGMRTGEIRITGSAGPFAACGMVGGVLRIDGSAGDCLGAARPGERIGMRDGLVLVGGDIGDRAGDHMRRGAIFGGGDAGSWCGARMIAGTIAVRGRLGGFAGFAMRRGTLLASALSDAPLATFADAGLHELGILAVIARPISRFAPWLVPLTRAMPRARRLTGDLAVDGKGEILLACDLA